MRIRHYLAKRFIRHLSDAELHHELQRRYADAAWHSLNKKMLELFVQEAKDV